MSPSPPMPSAFPGWTLFPAPKEGTAEEAGGQEAAPQPAADWRTFGRTRPSRAGSILAGQWELRERIGVGGMSEVYAATCFADREEYAAKLLEAEYAADPTMLARFRHEFWVLRQIKHPHLIAAHAYFEDGDEHFYSMELLKGESLSQALDRGPLEVGRGLRLGLQLCAAVTALHDRGVLHRDLKPGNVFLTQVNGVEHVKLLDLGICKLTPRWYAQAKLRTRPDLRIKTQAGLVVGTPGYIGPTSDDGDFSSEVSRDVFGLGVTLFRVLFGRLPYVKSPPGEDDEPTWYPEDDERVPSSVADILKQAIAPDPALRFSSIESFREELELAAMELGAIPCVSESSPVGEEPPAGPFESRRAAERMNDAPRRAEIVAVVDDDRLRQATTPRRGPGKILVALLGAYVTIDLVGHVVGYFRGEAEAETEAEPQAQKGVAALASERSVDAVDAPQHSPESQVIDSELRLSNTASCVPPSSEADAFVELKLDEGGRLADVRPSEDVSALTVACLKKNLGGRRLWPGGQSTHRILLSSLQRSEDEHDEE